MYLTSGFLRSVLFVNLSMYMTMLAFHANSFRLLRHFRGHKNITCLYDLDITNPSAFNEVYLYEELMEADLHAIVR